MLAERADYEWMRDTIRSRGLASKVKSFSHRAFSVRSRLKSWWAGCSRMGSASRVQLQMHKYIWGATAEGV